MNLSMKGDETLIDGLSVEDEFPESHLFTGLHESSISDEDLPDHHTEIDGGIDLDKIKSDVNVLVLARDRESTIASTIYKIRNGLHPARVSVTIFDDGSKDDTSIIASMAGARVVRYKTRHDMSIILTRILKEASIIGSGITVMLDLLGENTAEDAVGLAGKAFSEGDDFHIGYVRPGKGSDTIGCIALDRKNVDLLASKEENVRDILLEMAHSRGIVTERLSSSIETVSRRKKRESEIRKRPLLRLWEMMQKNPLKFYGGSGTIVFLLAMLSGFYTINYFYVHNNLYYPSAFITVLLVMISGFLMGAGVMLNALAIMVERVKALKKWDGSTRSELK